MTEQEQRNRTLYTKHVVSDVITWRVGRTLTQMATSELLLKANYNKRQCYHDNRIFFICFTSNILLQRTGLKSRRTTMDA